MKDAEASEAESEPQERLGPPAPPVPNDVELSGFRWLPLPLSLLSEPGFVQPNAEASRCWLSLLLASFGQRPGGSLPSEDRALCALAGIGRDTVTWKKLRRGALHGWAKCSDGRLYHPLAAEIALSAWEQRRRLVAKREGDAARQRRKRERESRSDVTRDGAVTSRPIRQDQIREDQNGQEALASASAARAGRAHLLPESWCPDPAAAAAEGISPEVAAREVEHFRDWARSKGVKRVDWDATWRNWLRKARDFFPGPELRPKPETIEERVKRIAERIEAGAV